MFSSKQKSELNYAGLLCYHFEHFYFVIYYSNAKVESLASVFFHCDVQNMTS